MQEVESGVYKTISYKLVRSGKTLIVVLPRAGANFSSHYKLINKATKYGSVLFIESGYYGISKVNEKTKNEYSISQFYKKLSNLIDSLKYQKVMIVAESVGAIHALKYVQSKFDSVRSVILCNPALYNPKLTDKLILIPLLNLGISFSPTIVLSCIAFCFKKIPIRKTRYVGRTFEKMNNEVGAASYLYCLREIVNFSDVYLKMSRRILDRTIILKGGDDFIFDQMCNIDFCKASSKFLEIKNGEHSLLDSSWSEVIDVIKSVS